MDSYLEEPIHIHHNSLEAVHYLNFVVVVDHIDWVAVEDLVHQLEVHTFAMVAAVDLVELVDLVEVVVDMIRVDLVVDLGLDFDRDADQEVHHCQMMWVACQHDDNHLVHLVVVEDHNLADHMDNHFVVDKMVAIVDSQDNDHVVAVVVDNHLCIVPVVVAAVVVVDLVVAAVAAGLELVVVVHCLGVVDLK